MVNADPYDLMPRRGEILRYIEVAAGDAPVNPNRILDTMLKAGSVTYAGMGRYDLKPKSARASAGFDIPVEEITDKVL
ncbi:MAG: hypothetical protein ABIJ34_08320 [archaeon]